MKRRVLAKRSLKKSSRVWFKDYEGKNVVDAYRKHFHASWSCAIIELKILGVSFTDEETAEAERASDRGGQGS
jgi:hypothetical protein